LSYARAVNLFNKGSYGEAVPHYAVAIDALKRAQPGNMGLMNAVRRNQIHAQTMAGLFAEAGANANAFLQELQGRPGDQSLWIALVKLASARSIGYQNRGDEAMKMLAEAEVVIVERFGAKSFQHLSLLTETLAVATRKGDHARAYATGQELYETVRVQYGEQHPQTARMLLAWGFTALEAGRDDKATEMLKTACAELEKKTGIKNAMTQNCMMMFTTSHLASGRMAEAEALLGQIDVDVLRRYRTAHADPEVVRAGAQGLIDLARGDAAGRPKVQAAIAALDKAGQPKDRFYRMLKAAESAGQ
jgi:hypothetical protein